MHPITFPAADLFALSQGSINSGRHVCHWCGTGCGDGKKHDDPPPVPFLRTNSTARQPGSPYICNGCWLYRRGSITVTNLNGVQADRQKCQAHSWWITREWAWGIASGCYDELRAKLLAPPLDFALMMGNGEVPILLQLGMANRCAEITSATSLDFTFNNVPHQYTPYELNVGLRTHASGGNLTGLPSGVRLLVDVLTCNDPKVFKPPYEVKPPKEPRGHPKMQDPEDTRRKLA